VERAQVAQPAAQMLRERRRPLPPTRVEIGAAQRAAGGKRADALAAGGADMGATGTHLSTIKQRQRVRPVRDG